MRVLLRVQYKGTDYCGWQRQKNGFSVQEVLANAVRETTGEGAVMHGSGRTDAGVHAIAQAVHFDTHTKIPMQKLPIAINAHLPSSVRVLSAQEVDAGFNARFDAVSKTYLYKMYVSSVSSPLRDGLCAFVHRAPDLDRMRRAAGYLLGEHDFKVFQAAGGHVKSTVRTISALSISEQDGEISFEVTGNGFLYNMVRIIVGTLVDLGRGKLTLDDVKNMLKTGKREYGGKTVQPNGLYLYDVEY